MEITLEALKARRAELEVQVKQAEADLNAKFGALQQVTLLIAQAEAPAPAET